VLRAADPLPSLGLPQLPGVSSAESPLESPFWPEPGARLSLTLRDGITQAVTAAVLVPPGCRFHDFVARVASALELPSTAHVGRIVRADGSGPVSCGRTVRELRSGESLLVAPVHIKAWDFKPMEDAVVLEIKRRGPSAMLEDHMGAFVEIATCDTILLSACEDAAATGVCEIHAEMLAEACTIQHHAVFDAVLDTADQSRKIALVDARQGRRCREEQGPPVDSRHFLGGSGTPFLGALSADLWLSHESSKASVEKDIANAIWCSLVAEAAHELRPLLGHGT